MRLLLLGEWRIDKNVESLNIVGWIYGMYVCSVWVGEIVEKGNFPYCPINNLHNWDQMWQDDKYTVAIANTEVFICVCDKGMKDVLNRIG